MPTENEVKFVLTCELNVIETLVHKCDDVKHITQTYIHCGSSWNARVRHIVSDDKEIFVYTYKNKKHDRVLEIETEIDAEDYYDLIKYPKADLTKTRLIFNTDDHIWEVDLFKDDDENIYFIMAEVEMPVGMTYPKSIPKIIKQFIIHDAGYSRKFSSKKLSSRLYAKTVYNDIINGKL